MADGSTGQAILAAGASSSATFLPVDTCLKVACAPLALEPPQMLQCLLLTALLFRKPEV